MFHHRIGWVLFMTLGMVYYLELSNLLIGSVYERLIFVKCM